MKVIRRESTQECFNVSALRDILLDFNLWGSGLFEFREAAIYVDDTLVVGIEFVHDEKGFRVNLLTK